MRLCDLRKGMEVRVGDDYELTVERAGFFHFATAGVTLGLLVALDQEGNLVFEANGYGGQRVAGFSVSPMHMPCSLQPGESAAIVPDTKAMIAVSRQYFHDDKRGQRGIYPIDRPNSNWLLGTCAVEATAVLGVMPFAADGWRANAQFVMLIGEYDPVAPKRKGYLAFFNARGSVVNETGWLCQLDSDAVLQQRS